MQVYYNACIQQFQTEINFKFCKTIFEQIFELKKYLKLRNL